MNYYFISSAIKDDYLYWITESDAFLLRMNLLTFKVSFLEVDWEMETEALVGNAIMACSNDTLYGVIGRGKYLFAYNLNDRSVQVKKAHLDKYCAYDFPMATVLEGHIYFLPYISPKLIKINMDSLLVSEIDIGIASFSSVSAVTTNAIENKNQLVCLRYDNNEMIHYSIQTDQAIYGSYPEIINNPIYICHDDTSYYVLNLKGDVFMWDGMDYCKKIYSNSGGHKEDYCTIYAQNGYVWLLPWRENIIKRVTIEDGSEKVWGANSLGIEYCSYEGMPKYSGFISWNNVTYFAMHGENHIYCIDESNNGKALEEKWPGDEYYLKKMAMRNYVVNEKESSLNSFINSIIERK